MHGIAHVLGACEVSEVLLDADQSVHLEGEDGETGLPVELLLAEVVLAKVHAVDEARPGRWDDDGCQRAGGMVSSWQAQAEAPALSGAPGPPGQADLEELGLSWSDQTTGPARER
ncbi:MAG TPA: hypothetical protein QGF58_23025 [Myxococcota bacterium]|nr:hypothetical protein [Myxococcota bacterium]